MAAAREREMLVMQLLATRAQIDATLSVLGVRVDDGSDAIECEHPREQREVESTFGEPLRWRCALCGFVYDEAADTATVKES